MASYKHVTPGRELHKLADNGWSAVDWKTQRADI
jgi:hypothetical protein